MFRLVPIPRNSSSLDTISLRAFHIKQITPIVNWQRRQVVKSAIACNYHVQSITHAAPAPVGGNNNARWRRLRIVAAEVVQEAGL